MHLFVFTKFIQVIGDFFRFAESDYRRIFAFVFAIGDPPLITLRPLLPLRLRFPSPSPKVTGDYPEGVKATHLYPFTPFAIGDHPLHLRCVAYHLW